jgi:signal transduction histidine kinase
MLAGALLVGSYHWWESTYAYWTIGLYGAAGAIAGAARTAKGGRAPWWLIAGGVTFFVAGDVAWDLLDMLGSEPVSPNLSDALYFVGYALVAAGLIVLSQRMGNRGVGTTVDALIVALAAATILWPVFFATAMHDKHVPLGVKLTEGAYPSFDLVFLLLTLRIALMRSQHSRRTRLLGAAAVLYLVGDLCWFQSIDTYALDHWMDYLWLGAYIAFGAAALHPAPVVADETSTAPLRRFALLAAPVAVLPAAILTETLVGRKFTLVDGLLVSGLLLLLLGRLGSFVLRLDRAQRDLREQNRLKDELISVVSHDLRTPLTSIMGYLELALADDTDQETARDFLEVVKRNTSRLHRLVEDLLFVSRVQSGREALDLDAVDVGALVEETVAAAVPSADGAEVILQAVVLSHDTLLLDAHRIAEVLENLLSNAVKFTPPGGRVDVWTGREVDELVLRVSDTGVGIAPEDCAHLFDRFFRATGAEGVPGAGLGLSIVKAIVEAHDGSVSVSSEIGAGTTFEVRLPLVLAERGAPLAVAA